MSDVGAQLARDTFSGVELVREAASGGMGRVFEGVEIASGRRVAVKLVTGTSLARFAAEAEILERMAAPEIVAYVAHGVVKTGEPYLIMEWLDGETLATRLAREGISLGDAVRVARRIAAALAYAHAHGIVHRDVKPANVFLVGKAPAEAKLIDFGIAREVDTDRTALTATGQLVGTPGYMAPEQALGRRDLDGRVDLFALGCLLHEMLYGQPPFPGTEVVEVLAKVLMHDPVVVEGRDVPPRLASLASALLAKEPDQRLATAALVEAELGEIADALARDDRKALRREPFPRPRTRRRSRWIPLAIAGVAIAGGAAFWIARRGGDDEAVCTGGQAAFTATWSAERAKALRDNLARVGIPELADPLSRALDRYRDSWIAAHGEACRATRVRREQTEAMLDLRMVCLARRRQAVDALVGVLASADNETVRRAPAAVASLPAIADCAQIATLKQIEPPPADPNKRMELDALAARLAAARVRYQTGGFEAALTEARAITTAARALQYRPFEAEAGLLQGQLEHRMNQIDAAIATLETAVWAAEAGRNDEVAARGWVLLVFLVGYEHNDPARAQEFAQRTSAAIARLGGNNDIEASLEQALGAIAANQNKLADAVTHFQKAIPLLEKQFGADHPNVAGVRENLATALLMQGDARGAVLAMQQVLAMRENKLEASHPLIGRARLYLGNARLELGEYALAEQDLRAALAILERNLPPTHPEIADLHASLARAVDKLGKRDEALELGKKATELAEAAYGAEHASFATQLLAFGNQLAAAGREREAGDAFARAEAIYTKASARADVARVWVARAKLAERRRPTDAIALLERALPILATAEGTHEAAAQAMSRLATIYLDRRQPARALAVLARPLDRDKLALETTAELDLVSARAASEAAR